MATVLIPLVVGAALSLTSKFLFPSAGQTSEGSRVNTNDIPQSQYGGNIPRAWGYTRVTGQLIWAQPLLEQKEEIPQEGGKGGGGEAPTEYKYYGNFAVLLAAGEYELITLRADSEVIWTVAPGTSEEILQNNAVVEKYFRFYSGSSNQDPDPLIQAGEGVDKTPGYRGYSYIVFDKAPLEEYGNRLPTISADIVSTSTPTNVESAISGFCPDTIYTVEVQLTDNQGFISNVSAQVPSPVYGVRIVKFQDPHTLNYDPGVNPPDGYGVVEIVSDLRCYTIAVGIAYGTGYFYSERGENNRTITLASPSGIEPKVEIINIDPKDACPLPADYTGTQATFDYGTCLVDLVQNSSGVYVPINSVAPTATGTYTLTYNTGKIAGGDRYTFSDIQFQTATVTGTPPFRVFYSPDESNNGEYTYGTQDKIVDATDTVIVAIPQNPLTTNNTVIASVQGWYDSSYPPGYYPPQIQPNTETVCSPNDDEIQNVKTPDTVTLSDVIRDICVSGGLREDNIDVTNLADIPVQGYLISSVDTARSHIEKLQVAYLFDVFQDKGKLWFKKQARVPEGTAGTIPAQMFAPVTNDEPEFELALVNRKELPTEFRVRYLDIDKEFQDAEQYARRWVAEQLVSNGYSIPPESYKNVEQFEAQISLHANDARILAEQLLYLALSRQKQYRFKLPVDYLAIAPGDVSIVTFPGDRTEIVKFTKVEIGADYRVAVEAVSFDPSIYGYTIAIPNVVRPPSVNLAEVTRAYYMDIPIWNESQSDNVVYGAFHGSSPAWRGADVYQSTDSGVSYQQVGATTVGAKAGNSLSVLRNARPEYADEDGTVDVLVFVGQLISITEEEWLNGRNLALLGKEIIAFRSATLIGDRQYRLSGLRRGLYGTEAHTGRHYAGELFVFLSIFDVTTFSEPTSLLNVPRRLKAVTTGVDAESVGEQLFTNKGAASRPLSPVHLLVEKEVDGSRTLSWVRRSRKYALWQNYIDAPLNETIEKYRVEIRDINQTVIRTEDTFNPSFYYSAADQIADFGSVQVAVAFTVYQLSTIVGRGFGASVIG